MNRSKTIQLEIAHILFLDIVGYSKLLIDEQTEVLAGLNEMVSELAQVSESQQNGRLIRIPTGDGMALVFSGSLEQPVQCAVAISRALRNRPELRLRIGLHTGPVNQVTDVTGRLNVTGPGINLAQRVMDCGDAGHILLSKRVADDLSQYRSWKPYLHETGEHEVKHGERIGIVNFYGEDFGNSAPPCRRAVAERKRSHVLKLVFAVLAVVLGSALVVFIVNEKSKKHGGQVSELGPSAGIVAHKGIAVLPFENLSEDKSNSYFADGVQDEILTKLANISQLKVISRTSTLRYKSHPDDPRKIATELGVANLLEGSVQKAGDAVHVNVQLINALTDSHVWAQSFDGKLSDIFGFEGQVAMTVAAELQAKLSGKERAVVEKKLTTNPQAYDFYLRGLAVFNRYNQVEKVTQDALSYYQRAVDLDPNFAAAWAQLSIVNGRLYFLGYDRSRERMNRAKEAADRALELQPDSAESRQALGYYQYWVARDYDSALQSFRQAQTLQPNNAEAIVAISYIERRQGLFDQAVAHGLQALELDPRNPPYLGQVIVTYHILKKFSECEAMLRRFWELLPDDPQTRAGAARVRLEQGDIAGAKQQLLGVRLAPDVQYAFEMQVRLPLIEHDYDEAKKGLVEALSTSPAKLDYRRGEYRFLLAWTQRLSGNESAARKTYRQAQKELEDVLQASSDQPEALMYLAFVHAALGEKEPAIRRAKEAMGLRPSIIDHWSGPGYEEALARVKAQTGDTAGAIADLNRLLKTNYIGPESMVLTRAVLKVDPVWDSLRGEPAFQALLR